MAKREVNSFIGAIICDERYGKFGAAQFDGEANLEFDGEAN